MELGAIGLLDDGDIDLVEAGIALALADRPEADPGPLRRLLTGWAIALQRDPAPATALARARRLAELIASDAGLTGASEDYENPLNADLIAVAERRRGLPVALSILYVTLARRMGWQAEALNLPGHVIVEVKGGIESALIDPFDHGTLITPARAMGIARAAGGEPQPGTGFPAMDNRHILVRLITNQAGRARAGGDVRRALVLYERMCTMAPAFSSLWWERARLEQLLGDTRAARASLSAMLETTHDKGLARRINATLTSLARSDS